jgi:hypothetical protein
MFYDFLTYFSPLSGVVSKVGDFCSPLTSIVAALHHLPFFAARLFRVAFSFLGGCDLAPKVSATFPIGQCGEGNVKLVEIPKNPPIDTLGPWQPMIGHQLVELCRGYANVFRSLLTA